LLSTMGNTGSLSISLGYAASTEKEYKKIWRYRHGAAGAVL
jgi:hypothetical protein